MARLLLILAGLGLGACAAPARDYSTDIVRIRLAEAPAPVSHAPEPHAPGPPARA